MRKFFQALGMICLICLSFVYTEKAVNVVKQVDDIMIKIKEENQKYKQKPINAIIKENTIIPGINGKAINEDKSYAKMKRIGSYNPKLLEYEIISPEVSISNTYDKYVIKGNDKKKVVSIIFIVKSDDNLDEIINILNKKEVKGNFFINSTWLEENNNKLINLIKEGHIVGNLSHNMDYTHSDFVWMDTIIKKIADQKNGYCYNEVDNEEALKMCALHKNHTIRPNIITSKYPTIEIQEEITNGSIISLKTNDIIKRELSTIINFIHSKGYKIDTLDKLLSEEH